MVDELCFLCPYERLGQTRLGTRMLVDNHNLKQVSDDPGGSITGGGIVTHSGFQFHPQPPRIFRLPSPGQNSLPFTTPHTMAISKETRYIPSTLSVFQSDQSLPHCRTRTLIYPRIHFFYAPCFTLHTLLPYIPLPPLFRASSFIPKSSFRLFANLR